MMDNKTSTISDTWKNRSLMKINNTCVTHLHNIIIIFICDIYVIQKFSYKLANVCSKAHMYGVPKTWSVSKITAQQISKSLQIQSQEHLK